MPIRPRWAAKSIGIFQVGVYNAGMVLRRHCGREIEEETGVREVTIGKHAGMVLSPIRLQVQDRDVGLILSIYECSIPEEAVIVPSDGLDDYAWLAPPEAAKRLQNKYPAEFCELVAVLQ